MERKIKYTNKGYRAVDGAGVSLVRVLGGQTVDIYDPILMLDSFDSTSPDDYVAGFPTHPHRGIETISYVYKGYMTHKDSLGNEDTIGDGEVQWMTAGSGILHAESLPAADRLLGVQLWLNLPAKDKMCQPAYNSIKTKDIKEIPFDGGMFRLLAGTYRAEKGYMSKYLPLNYYDIHLKAASSIKIDTAKDDSIMLFTLLGAVTVAGEEVQEKTAVKLEVGTYVEISSKEPAQVLFVSSKRLDEPIIWGGPIVMNTREELEKAFDDLQRGTFLSEDIDY